MMQERIDTPASVENALRIDVRSACLNAISARGWSEEEAADALGILPSGYLTLSISKVWPVDVALRVAEVVGVPIHFEVGGISS